MIAHAMLIDDKYKSFLEDFTKNNKIHFKVFNDIEKFKASSFDSRPTLFFIQADNNSTLDIINLVGDIRSIFGIISSIVILGDHISRKKLGDFLANGADQFFSYPLDKALVEDFLSQRTDSKYWQGFKYRNIPGRSHDVEILFDVQFKEIHSGGIKLSSKNLIKTGTLISFNLENFIEELKVEVQLQVISSDILDEDSYLIATRFVDVDKDIKSKIINYIRNG